MHSTATPFPYPTALQHEGRHHAYHICVLIYRDVLHEHLAVLHADRGSTLDFADDSAKSSLLHSASYVQPRTPHPTQVTELGST
jgi:hypothetical protein